MKEAAVCDAMTDDAIISEILNLYGSMAEWFTYTGPTTITSSGDFGTLVPGTDYYVLAFGYADGAAATELTKHKFTTDPEGDPTANTFAFDISGVTARSASIQVEPSDKSVRYIWDIVTDAEYKKYGGNAEGIRSYLADYIKGQIDDFFTTPEEVVSVIGVRGDQWFDYEQLKPATTYYVWAACVDAAGNATATPAVSPAFTTEAAVVSTATATVEFEKYYNGSELYAIDDVTYKNYNNKAYLPAKVLHSADAVKWYTLYTGTDVGDTELYTDDLLIQYLVTQGTPDGEERRYGLTWNAKAYILAVAQDAEGRYGPVFPQEHHALAQRRFPDQRPRIRDRRRRNAKYTGHAACRNTGRTAQTDGARRPLTETPQPIESPLPQHCGRGLSRRRGCRTYAAGSMCVEPVLAHTAFGDQFHFEMRRLLHRLGDDFAHAVQLAAQRVDHHFVVHLQNHLRADSFAAERFGDMHHRDLHDVGRTALNRGVDGIAFGQPARHGIARRDVVQVTPPPEDRRHVTHLARPLDHMLHILLHLGVGGEIALYDLFGLLARNVEPLAQPEGRDAVDDAEIGRLGLASLVARHRIDRFAEEPRGRRGMDVLAVLECRDQRLVAAQMRHQAQLDLTVIGRQQHMVVV